MRSFLKKIVADRSQTLLHNHKEDEVILYEIKLYNKEILKEFKTVVESAFNCLGISPTRANFDDKTVTVRFNYSFDELVGLAELLKKQARISDNNWAFIFLFGEGGSGVHSILTTKDGGGLNCSMATPDLEAGQEDGYVISLRLRNNLAVTKHKEVVKQYLKTLLKQAREFYQANKSCLPQEWIRPESIGSQSQPMDIFKSLLVDYSQQGLCLGEASHLDPSVRRYLTENMDQLVKLGVKTLYVEFVPYDLQQKELDQAFQAKTGLPMMTKAYLYPKEYLSESFTAMLESAFKSGIRVVAVDTVISCESYRTGSDSYTASLDSQQRMLTFNYLANQRIKENSADGSKWVMLAGAAHQTENKGVEGVAHLFGLPSICMGNFSQGTEGSMSFDVLIEEHKFDIQINLPR